MLKGFESNAAAPHPDQPMDAHDILLMRRCGQLCAEHARKEFMQVHAAYALAIPDAIL